MATSYKDFEFSLPELRIIKRLKRHPISKNMLCDPKYKFLVTYTLVDRCYPGSDLFCLNEKGKMYLRYRRKSNRKYILTTAIAIFAAVGAYRSELASLLQAIEKLLK